MMTNKRLLPVLISFALVSPLQAAELAKLSQDSEPAGNWMKVAFTDPDGRQVTAWCRECAPEAKNKDKTFPLFELYEQSAEQKGSDYGAGIGVFKTDQLPYFVKVVEKDVKGAKSYGLTASRDDFATGTTAAVMSEKGKRVKPGSEASIVVLSPTAWHKLKSSPFTHTAKVEGGDCKPDFLLTDYYHDSDAASASLFSWWHPTEIELLRGIKIAKGKGESYGEFEPKLQDEVGSKDSALSKEFARVYGQIKAGNRPPAAAFAQQMVRPKFSAAAKTISDSSANTPALRFSKFESIFLKCRMGYAGKADQFREATQAAEGSQDELAKFVLYWRAFVRSELSQYQTEAAGMGTQPAAVDALYGAWKDRTLKALAGKDEDRKAMFARTKLPDPGASTVQVQPKKDKTDQGPQPKPVKPGTPTALSDDELALLTKPESDAYSKRMAGALELAKTDPAGSLQAQKDIVAEYRKQVATRGDSSMNLGADELAAFGSDAPAVKAQIDALQGDARKAKVSQLRQIVKVWQSKRNKDGSRITLDQLKIVESDPSKADQIFSGNRAEGVVVAPNPTGTGGRSAQDVADELNQNDQKTPKGGLTIKDPGKPTEDKVAESDDGGKTWKKDLPNIANGVRMGIWAGVLGFFLAGPMGVALFAVAGGLAGYGMSKVSRSLDD